MSARGQAPVASDEAWGPYGRRTGPGFDPGEDV